MPLIQLIVFLIIIGFLMWIVNTYIPDPLKKIINVVVAIVIVLWILTLFFPGLMHMGPMVGPRQ